MNEDKPFVFVIDDDPSMRDSLRNLIRSARSRRTDIRLGARVLNEPASGCPGLPRARCTATGIKRS